MVALVGPNVDLLVNTSIMGNQDQSSVVALANGGFLVVWTDSNALDGAGDSIRAQRFDANGEPVGKEFQINKEGDGDQFDAAVTVLANGNFVVTWNEGDSSGGDPVVDATRGRLFRSDGKALGDDFLVSTVDPSDFNGPSISALSGGGFVTAYANESLQPLVQRFSATGSKVGTEIAVPLSTYALDMSIAGLVNGGFVVAWTNMPTNGANSQVRAQVHDTDGVAIGASFPVGALNAAVGQQVNVTALSHGGFVATWSDLNGFSDGSGFSINGRVFDAGGNPVGDIFLVNTTFEHNQASPQVIPTANGGFAVVWRHAPDGAGTAIHAELFNSAGGKEAIYLPGIGFRTELKADTSGFATAKEPDIAVLKNGDLVITWTDTGFQTDDNSGTGVRMKVFKAYHELVGNLSVETLNGGNGRDLIDGAAGGDKLYGKDGDDILLGGDGGDRLDGGKGIDTVSYARDGSGVIADLLVPGNNTQDAEGDTYFSIENMSGSLKGDDLAGDNKANIIDGDEGSDTLVGRGGNDRLIGGNAGDVLIGGAGRDVLIGGRLPDEFRFELTSESKAGAQRDVIVDFFSGSDVINLELIDAKKGGADDDFVFIDDDPFSHTKGELRYKLSGADVIVQGDVTGDGKADFEILVKHVTALAGIDFVI